MNRRTFLKIFGFLGPIAVFFGRIPLAFAGKWEKGKANFWKGKAFVQKNVDLKKYGQGIVRARINGTWADYRIQKLSDAFAEWNLKSRLEGLDNIKAGKMPNLSGPHSGAVATYGGTRLDSQVTINNAVKGIGLAPRADRIEAAIKKLKETIDRPMPEKLDILKSFYEDTEFVDWTKMTSLELYTEPSFETHSFLNLMENPIASVVFLDVPSYEVRAVTRMVHPLDQSATKEEKNLLEYVNLIHSYFHGEFKIQFIVMIFHVIELFDNSPGKMKGIRVVPGLPR
jgi:hypothetical protein